MAGTSKMQRLNNHIWLIIQGRYEKGDSVRGLAREYGINPATICNRAKKYGWLEHGSLNKEAINKARTEITDDLGATYKTLAKQAIGNHYKLFRYIQQLGLKFVQEVEKNSKLPAASRSNINREIYQLNVLSQTIKNAVDGERVALGMDKINWDDEKDAFDKFTQAIEKMRGEKGIAHKTDEIEASDDIDDYEELPVEDEEGIDGGLVDELPSQTNPDDLEHAYDRDRIERGGLELQESEVLDSCKES